MTLTIHRGTHCIGGSVIELRTNTTRIFLDLGTPLPDENGSVSKEILPLSGVTQPGDVCHGVFFTHIHSDHMGQIGHILPTVPLYFGGAAREIALILYRRLERGGFLANNSVVPVLERAHVFQPGVPLTVGNIRITPLLTDHSAFDAYMFLVEAENVRLLYTGDFRIHGPRGKTLFPVLKRYVRQVDWLVCEGTMLSRSKENRMTEWNVGIEAQKIMRNYRNVFVLCASTNIDRIAALTHRTPHYRPVICDRYQKEILNCVERHSGDKSNFYRFDRVISYSENNLKLLKWMQEQGFLMFVRANERFHKLMEPYRNECIVLYSMWSGYLNGGNSKISEFLTGFPVMYLHTGGHADTETIRAVCQSVSPRCGIIPIHGESPETFCRLFPESNVVILEDTEVLAL